MIINLHQINKEEIIVLDVEVENEKVDDGEQAKGEEERMEITEIKENKEVMKQKSTFAKYSSFLLDLVLLPIKMVRYVFRSALEGLRFVLKEIVREIIKIAIKVTAYAIFIYILISLIDIYSGISTKTLVYELLHVLFF